MPQAVGVPACFPFNCVEATIRRFDMDQTWPRNDPQRLPGYGFNTLVTVT